MHKKRRPLLRIVIELLGLALLGYGAWHERATIMQALRIIRSGDLVYVLGCFSLLWFNFLWSGMGYYLLVEKPINLLHICLAHLSASGPGRVIPGGAGHMSFGVLFLRKHGHSFSSAVAISTTNNLLGFVVNIIVLWALLLTHHYHIRTGNLHLPTAHTLAYTAIVVLVGILLLQHYSKLAKRFAQTKKSYQKVFKSLVKRPWRALFLLLMLLATMATNALILYMAGRGVGLHLHMAECIIATSGGVALGSLVPTPGGVGGVEAGLIATLYALGYPVELATSTALLYRASTYLQPILPGLAAYVWLRQKNEL